MVQNMLILNDDKQNLELDSREAKLISLTSNETKGSCQFNQHVSLPSIEEHYQTFSGY